MSNASGGQDPLPVHAHSTTRNPSTHRKRKIKYKKKEDYTRTCLGIKRATADGGHFCGIRRRGSFWVEQGVVGVSTLLFLKKQTKKLVFI